MYTNYYIYIHIYVKMWIHFKRKTFEFFYSIIFQWPFFGKKNWNTWFEDGKTFVGSTRINKIYFSYIKPSFDLWIYIIQTFF
jgi:hypothetical protein